MSLIKVSTLGNSLQWTATFTDFDDALVSPGAATLHVVYEGGKADIDMTAITTGEFVAEWDSSVASAAGIAYWAIRTSGPPIAAEGQINLAANPANPAA